MRSIRSVISTFLVEHFRIVLALVAAILLLLGYVFLLGPELTEVRQFGVVDLASEEQRREERVRYRDRLEDMLERYDRLNAARISELDQVIPPESDAANLFVVADALAKENELNLNSIAIAPSGQASGRVSAKTGETQAATDVTPHGLNAFDLSLSVSGGTTYEHFKRFLTSLEDSLRIMNVLSFSFSPESAARDGTSDQKASATYTINLRTYYATENEAGSSQ